MVWGRQTVAQQLVLTTTPEETTSLAFGYVQSRTHKNGHDKSKSV